MTVATWLLILCSNTVCNIDGRVPTAAVMTTETQCKAVLAALEARDRHRSSFCVSPLGQVKDWRWALGQEGVR